MDQRLPRTSQRRCPAIAHAPQSGSPGIAPSATHHRRWDYLASRRSALMSDCAARGHFGCRRPQTPMRHRRFRIPWHRLRMLRSLMRCRRRVALPNAAMQVPRRDRIGNGDTRGNGTKQEDKKDKTAHRRGPRKILSFYSVSCATRKISSLSGPSVSDNFRLRTCTVLEIDKKARRQAPSHLAHQPAPNPNNLTNKTTGLLYQRRRLVFLYILRHQHHRCRHLILRLQVQQLHPLR